MHLDTQRAVSIAELIEFVKIVKEANGELPSTGSTTRQSWKISTALSGIEKLIEDRRLELAKEYYKVLEKDKK